jgi:hypothetical protein
MVLCFELLFAVPPVPQPKPVLQQEPVLLPLQACAATAASWIACSSGVYSTIEVTPVSTLTTILCVIFYPSYMNVDCSSVKSVSAVDCGCMRTRSRVPESVTAPLVKVIDVLALEIQTTTQSKCMNP